MELDQSGKRFNLTEAEQKFAKVGSPIGVSDAGLLLNAVLQAKVRMNSLDISEYAFGVRHFRLVAQREDANKLAADMERVLLPFVEQEHAQEIDTLLEGEIL